MEIDRDVQMEDVVDDCSLTLESEAHQYGVSVMTRNIPGELSSQALNQLDAWIESLSQCCPLSEENVETLCNMVCQIRLFCCC